MPQKYVKEEVKSLRFACTVFPLSVQMFAHADIAAAVCDRRNGTLQTAFPDQSAVVLQFIPEFISAGTADAFFQFIRSVNERFRSLPVIRYFDPAVIQPDGQAVLKQYL